MKMERKRSILIDRTGRIADRAPSIAALIYSSADTNFSRSMLQDLNTCDFGRIVSASVNPLDYTDACTFGRDYLCAELMSKYPNWELGVDRAQVALAKFVESEASCARVNGLLHSLLYGRNNDPETAGIFFAARRKIERLLGPFSWDEASSLFDWGPGASTSLKRRHGDAYYKFSAKTLDASGNTLPMVEALRLWRPLWTFNVNYVPGNRLTTVPKNAKTDRVIAIEPDLNMFFQKGVGGVIRQRLRRVGLLLPDAQEHNQALAKEGSTHGSFATIDLSSASDTISLEIVRELLPPDWVSAIEHCRSPRCVLPSGEVISLQKVSSMGNGFTFELETLIFWALARTVTELHGGQDRRVLVYGDDIIVPTQAADHLIDVLVKVGFSVNEKKTFVHGPFRESCGKHYFYGTDVTPFYFRKPIQTAASLFVAANAVERHSRLSWGRDARWLSTWTTIVSHLPPWARKLAIPDGAPEDSGLVLDFEDARPRAARSRKKFLGWDGFVYSHLSRVTVPRRVEGVGRLLKGLHSLERRAEHYADTQLLRWSNGVLDIDFDVPTSKPARLIESVSMQWPSFGPWL